MLLDDNFIEFVLKMCTSLKVNSCSLINSPNKFLLLNTLSCQIKYYFILLSMCDVISLIILYKTNLKLH